METTELQKLNEKELQALESLINEVMACTGGEFGYTSDSQTTKGMTRNEYKGYIGSLAKKGYILITAPDGEFAGQFVIRHSADGTAWDE